MTRLQAWAAGAPVSVFPAVGAGAALRVDELALDPHVALAATPRHASILLIAGEQRQDDREALWRVHDQLPHPRATLCWGGTVRGLESATAVAEDVDPAPELHALQRALVTGERASENDLLPDEPPNPWRGLGDFGQGGEGMMGGTPYGRMMPMPPQADLRDGLMLDAYSATVGPYLPSLPSGVALGITWQGDIIQQAQLARAPFGPPRELSAPVDAALREPVSVAHLERLRAAHHLSCIARVLDLLELHRLSRRCRVAARRARAGKSAEIETEVAGIARTMRRSGVLAALPSGLGQLPDAVTAQLGGPARRAAGDAVDARAHQPEYERLGFEPATQTTGDVRARVRQWLAEAHQSIELAERADAHKPVQLGPAVESPWGALGSTGQHEPAHAELDFTELLIGREWHEAALILASFDTATLGRMTRWRPDLVPVPTTSVGD